MADLPASTTLCSVCGGSLSAKGVCLACLLRAGLDEAEGPVAPEAVALFDDFEIDRSEDGSLWELGRGGMGVTYRATERTLHRSVALKVIDTHGSQAVRERFLREARAAAALRHPNVAGVFRFGAMAGGERCYCAMELVEGETLEAMVRRDGPLKGEAALEIAIQITRALISAADRGLVHRDLKPANIMLTPSENAPAKIEVKVIDFGLAKAASAGTGEMELTRGEFVGTPAFASPEQFAGGAIDARTDIYALGVTLWYALTGRLPFAGRTIEEIRQHQAHGELPLEQLQGVSRRVVELLRSCLAIDPAARPPSAKKLLEALESCRAQSTARRRTGKLAVLAGLAVLALGLVVAMFWPKRNSDVAVSPSIPEKSIAVLPFENRSRDPDNAYFADGIQDEILTRLSKISDLKVISRTSTRQYKSSPENLPEIARQLGVAYILEGSVQKEADAVRINVQLIKAATDSHFWADIFDRKMTDIFSVESEVAKAIADQLRVKLTGQEEQVIASRPTSDPQAYDAYLRGLAYTLKPANTTANTLGAQKYLREAVRLDPKFVLAWALLSSVDSIGYRTVIVQRTPALREEALQAAESALALQPKLGEAVLAKGYYYYGCLKDYDTAIRYFEQARQLLPNDSRIPESLAYVTRRRGQWDQSEFYFNEAERLDVRNANLLTQHAISYMRLRRLPEALRKLDQVLNITPDDVHIIAYKASIAQAQGDLPQAARLLAPLHPDADDATALETQVYQAILERRPESIIPRLKEIVDKPDPALGYLNGDLRVWLGWAQETAGDHAAAQKSWQQARTELESFLKDEPENFNILSDLALSNAGLGDKAAALALAERAIAANPLEEDAVSGPSPIETLARVAARMGEPDRAIAAIQKLLSIPAVTDTVAPITAALLRLDPMFDPLRNDPRFEKVLAEAETNVPWEAGAATAPAKSIAVLPFENLSEDKANEYFAAGVQDEILTRLAAVRELKVISRTSTAKYKSKPENLKKIAEELGVSTILEGSVQKAGDKVRINVQLISAANDSHLWAETYDRNLTDIFSVETEVAKAIADRLQAKFTSDGKQLSGAKPTDNTEAYDAYLRGLAYSLKTANNTANLLNAQKYLREAVRLDPKFALAWALLSYVEAVGYRTEFLQPTDALREESRHAAETALVLQPNLGEAVWAKGFYHYSCLRDYDAALRYFEQARALLPNSSRIPESLAFVTRKQGQWDQSETYFNEAERLDPRNVALLSQHALSYKDRRQFPEASRKLEQILNIAPDDVDTIVEQAVIAQAVDDLPRAAALLAPLHLEANNSNALETQIYQVILERRSAPIVPRLQGMLAKPDPALGFTNGELRFWLGWAQQISGDHTGADETWLHARKELESFLGEHPQDYILLGHLAMTDAALGDKAAAIARAEQGMAAMPIDKDAVSGPKPVEFFARVAAQVGETDRAIDGLQKLMTLSYSGALGPGAPLTPALLRLDPMFDRLRSDPRFQELSKEPQTVTSAQEQSPEKSIAVLPFENLSDDKQNAYFAEGIQDEILTRLAAVRDLKVISRTSTVKYKSKAENLKKVGQELGVSTILEGSVQKNGDKVRVIVQLIDARTDRHLWAKSYDRELKDVFAVESEVSQEIADTLRVKLSPAQSNALTSAPTKDTEAYDLFLRGEYEFHQAGISLDAGAAADRADAFYRRALARDPNFVGPAAELARSRLYRHWYVSPLAAAELEEVKSIIDRTLARAPSSPEAHLALGLFFYWGHRQYDMALAEFNRTLELQPNNADARAYCAWIHRRRGEWERSLADSLRAQELDPHDASIPQNVGLTYLALRRWKEAEGAEFRALALDPQNAVAAVVLVASRLSGTGDASSARGALDEFPEAIKSLTTTLYRRRGVSSGGEVAAITGIWVYLDVIQRRFTDAFQAFEKEAGDDDSGNLQLLAGRVALRVLAGKAEAAKPMGQEALPWLETRLRERPDDTFAMTELSWVYLALGRTADALRLSTQAADSISIEKDALDGPIFQTGLAQIEAHAGAPKEAIKRLRRLLSIPAGHRISIARLKNDPVWDPIRNRSDFQELLSGPEQVGPVHR